MKNKRKIAVLFLFVVISTFLTGCRTGKISKDMISYGYNKRIECIEVVNKRDGEISIDYEVTLLGKDKVTLYKETFTHEYINVDSTHKVNLEDVKPDYISYEQVESMDLKILNVYSYSTLLLILLIIVCVIVFAVILIVFFAWLGLI